VRCRGPTLLGIIITPLPICEPVARAIEDLDEEEPADVQLGLIGVFPYSAIDMGTYETLKKAYLKSTGRDEPEVYAVLCFGALSGSIGAASVYRKCRTSLEALANIIILASRAGMVTLVFPRLGFQSSDVLPLTTSNQPPANATPGSWILRPPISIHRIRRCCSTNDLSRRLERAV
jgi:hypothetical protein